ncbi:hypothetical protein SAMN05216486_10125 [bacterium JGI 053]|nr:hypothetical protein SAMN05216486_10125 [bacterium JGI 053]
MDFVKNRAAPYLLLLFGIAAAAVGAADARAQVIPMPGGRRPATSAPRVRPNERAPGARADTGRPRPTGGPAERDSVTDALLRLEGYVPVWYTADSADYRSDDRTLRLRGDSRVERAGQVITAKDSLVYQDRRDFVTAFGHPQATDVQGEPITGDVFYYNIASGRATARGARTKITDNATWFVEGNVTRERTNRIYASNSTFTSDDRAEPAYYFKADRIMIIHNRILIGRPAYLYFKNVPVMAIPFIVQDLENGRRSGFLIPQFEINDIVRTRGGRGGSRGTGREFSNIGYYWAMSPYMGLQLAGRWRSQSYEAVRTNLEFNFRRHFLSGQVEGERFWETDGPGRLNLNGGARWDMNERTNVSLSLGYASSTQFERNRVVDPFRQTADLSSNFALTRRTDWGSLSLTAERRQSIANDDRTFSPRLNVNVNPITLFPNATVTIGFSGSQQLQSFGDALVRRQPPQEQRDGNASLGLSLGDFRIASSASYNHNSRGSLAALDPALADSAQIRDTTQLLPIPGRGTDRISFTASTGYQLTLFASTRLTPTIGFSRDLVRRDTTGTAPDSVAGSYGTFVAGPPRLNIGAGLGTDLYGFFPGFGNYEAIRHHIQPIISWNYSPAAQVSDSAAARTQRQVFGEFNAKTVNQITLGLSQTFEAKVRESRPVRGDSSADSASAAGNRATTAPGQARKVMLLSINTNALAYSFEPIDRFGTRFLTPDLSTSIRTDLLGGLQFTMNHSLFEQRAAPADTTAGGAPRSELRRGRFSPFLTSFNTSFTLGQNSALFRWLGFSRPSEEQRTAERGHTPDAAGTPSNQPVGGATSTGNNQQAGGGPWSLAINYSLSRFRRTPNDTLPGFRGGNSQIGGSLTFQPTRNWGVSWRTDYSTSTGKFSAHTINLKRDLYRWQANFDYILAPNGNTSFAFSVHLIDLPDLKADYHENNLGIDRPQTTNTQVPLPAPSSP